LRPNHGLHFSKSSPAIMAFCCFNAFPGFILLLG
jgi:hypothetical protein